MYRANFCARVHLPQPTHEFLYLIFAGKVHLGDEDTVRKSDLFLCLVMFVKLLAATSAAVPRDITQTTLIPSKKEAGDPRWIAGSRKVDHAITNSLASATSTESPSWLRTSNPDSGTSPDVLCETMIFLAMSVRQVICDVAA